MELLLFHNLIASLAVYDENGNKINVTWGQSSDCSDCVETTSPPLPPGKYRVLLRDNSSDCDLEKYTFINESVKIETIVVTKNPGCDGSDNSGSITINVTSGTPEYTYKWEPNVSRQIKLII